MTAAPLFGGVELGGTKCVCLIGSGPHDIRSRVSIPTGDLPAVTLQRIEDTLREGIAAQGSIQALGVASFGPLDLLRQSRTYGSITSTAKPGWRNTQLVAGLAGAFRVPVGFDTDVNGAALAEGRWGAARGMLDFAYVTVGTGIGVGLVVGGRPVCGFTHAEWGHIRIARAPGDTWPGACVYHGDCLEGLASGAAIGARAGVPAHELSPHDPDWRRVAHALAQLAHTLVLSTAPRRILMGGGVIEGRPQLLPLIRTLLRESLNGYVDLETAAGGLDHYIAPPGLGSLAGPLGALALAADAL